MCIRDSSKTYAADLIPNEDGKRSSSALAQISLIKHLITLAKDKQLNVYQNSGPWGEQLIPISASEINQILMVKTERIVNDEVIVTVKPMDSPDFGPITFTETWHWNEQNLQLEKKVHLVTVNQMIYDKDSLVVGERPLLTFDLTGE